MATNIEELSQELGEKGIGSISNARFEEAALASVSAYLEAEPGQERWITPLIRAIERRRLRLPLLSPTLYRVVEIIESPDVDLDELAAAVSGDPVLATRIIGVANSSYFRGATEVPNVREALMRMGIREARTIVIVVALRGTVLRSPGIGSAATILWRHSLLTAVAAQEISSELPPWETSGFLAGLVHDIGKLVILAFASELPAWQDDGAVPSDELIEAISAATHAPLGALVLSSWGFPKDFAEAILQHHDPGEQTGPAFDLARIVELGHSMARQIDAGWPEDPTQLDPELSASAEKLGLTPERLSDIALEAETNFEVLNKLS